MLISMVQYKLAGCDSFVLVDVMLFIFLIYLLQVINKMLLRLIILVEEII